MSWLTPLRYQNTSTESLLLYHLLLRAFDKGMLFYTWWASLSCFAPAKCNSSLSSSSLPVHSPANQWQLLLCVMCRSSWLTPWGRTRVPREIHGRWIDVDLGSRIRIRMGIEDEQQKIGEPEEGRMSDWDCDCVFPGRDIYGCPLAQHQQFAAFALEKRVFHPLTFTFDEEDFSLSVPHERHKRMIRMGTE